MSSNKLKVLIHWNSAFILDCAKISLSIRYTPKRTHATIGKYTLLHRTIKSNAMVVDTTCMQAGLADSRAGAYQLDIINTELRVGSRCRMQMSATASVNSFLLNILSHNTEHFSEYKITVQARL